MWTDAKLERISITETFSFLAAWEEKTLWGMSEETKWDTTYWLWCPVVVHIAFVFVRLVSASRRGIPLWCRVSTCLSRRLAGEFPAGAARASRRGIPRWCPGMTPCDCLESWQLLAAFDLWWYLPAVFMPVAGSRSSRFRGWATLCSTTSTLIAYALHHAAKTRRN